jgi:uracil-DNA glycosylase
MSQDYLRLARRRSSERLPGYSQPEDFGYDFREWISPYTKGAHAAGSVAIVLQDWASTETLSRGVDPGVQAIGRIAKLKTNSYLGMLLGRLFGLDVSETYITNAFPYIKSGSMSAPVPADHVTYTVEKFTRPELELAKPKLTFALGVLARDSLLRCGVECIGVPHPAARIGGIAEHERIWRQSLETKARVAEQTHAARRDT